MSRYYRFGPEVYPSVTTILSATSVDSPELAAWKQRATAVELADAEQEKILGALRGGELHESVERFYLQGVEEPSELARPWYESVRHFFHRISVVRGIEVPVHHPAGYAGRVDMAAVVDGREAVPDWKSAKRPKPVHWLLDYMLQVTAYAGALRWMYGWSITNAHVVIGIPESLPQVLDLHEPDLRKLWPLWIDRVDRYRAMYPTIPAEVEIVEAV